MLLTQSPVPILGPKSCEITTHHYKQNNQANQSKLLSKASITLSEVPGEKTCESCCQQNIPCIVQALASSCESCTSHNKRCIFEGDLGDKKRRYIRESKLSNERQHNSTRKRRRLRDQSNVESMLDVTSTASSNTQTETRTTKSSTSIPVLYESLGFHMDYFGALTGHTSEHEPLLIKFCPFNAKDEYLSQWPNITNIRNVSEDIIYAVHPRSKTSSNTITHKRVEDLVSPHGPALVDLYFDTVHPTFPIVDQKYFRKKYQQELGSLPASLTAAIYLLALSWWTFDDKLARKPRPDTKALAKIGREALTNDLEEPTLYTIQAALLYLQIPERDSWTFTCQILAVAQNLGLHLDCSSWRIPQWEIKLRKILAWTLFMQDKWTALTEGRPSHITSSNWDVPCLSAIDFRKDAENDMNRAHSIDVADGHLLFMEMVELSKITAEILEEFFTVRTIYSKDGTTGSGSVEKVLSRAKPLQLRLKEWYVRLPARLRMDAIVDSKYNSNGSLHLSYFATEITLHRCIIRSINHTTSPYLIHICRTAAKTRLISSMDFINRLKPEHLKSFWYSASPKNFALIGTFGSLLWATSEVSYESEFYKARLDEYRWTLQVSQKQAPFMEYALKTIDAIFGYCMEGVKAIKDEEDLQHNGAGSLDDSRSMEDVQIANLTTQEAEQTNIS